MSRSRARRAWALWLATAAATGVLLGAGLPGETRARPPRQAQGLEAPSPSPSQRVRVRVQVFATRHDGPTAGPHVESFATLGVGDTLTRALSTAASGDPDLCQIGSELRDWRGPSV